jgi:Tfp pilus assembly protein PilV
VTAAAVIDLRRVRPNRLAAKLRGEDGVGLIELLIALLVLNVGIFATLGAFTSAATTIRRASHISTAAAVADKKMEGYRNNSFASIPPTATLPACPTTPAVTTSSATGADGRQYTVTTTGSCASQGTGGSAFVKQVTLQVSDPNDGNKVLVKSTSTFSRCTQASVGGSDLALTACQN